jgi:hypothetical protein
MIGKDKINPAGELEPFRRAAIGGGAYFRLHRDRPYSAEFPLSAALAIGPGAGDGIGL